MATITFKAKAAREVTRDNVATGVYIIPVPTLTRGHCDMAAFRNHPKYGGLANSDLFGSALTRISRDTFKWQRIRTDEVPPNVTVDLSGFLAVVTVEV